MRLWKLLRQMPKWVRMLKGASIMTTPQKKGMLYALNRVAGYYNDLTGKVAGDTLLDAAGVPYNITDRGETVYLPVSIIQYGLGLYDMYLATGEDTYAERLSPILDWVLSNQHECGGWGIDMLNPKRAYYSAMIQGEGISFLVRMMVLFHGRELEEPIEKAYIVLKTPVADGGCAVYTKNDVFLLEYPDKPFILNGAIFALWGMYDYSLAGMRDKQSRELMDRVVKTIAAHLPTFDCGYWSRYDLGNMIASPFYHDLHIAQLSVLSEHFPTHGIETVHDQWVHYQKSAYCVCRSIAVKIWQKISQPLETGIVR